MAKISEKEVLETIQNALDLKGECITVDSSMNNVEEWDSLGHVTILVALDCVFNGKVGSIREMATANSVQGIIQILKDNSLI